jgi:uncharacterized protein YuzE
MLPYHRILVEMKPVFANPIPIDYYYEPDGDVLYLTFAREPASRTLEILGDWPMLLADLNAENQIIGLEYVGFKQFGVETFVRLVRERVRRDLGIELDDQDTEYLASFARSREATIAVSG